MDHLERAFFRSPVGYLEITGSVKGIRSVKFLDFRVRINRVPHSLRQCYDQLDEYFKGKRRHFDLPLDLDGSVFQMHVWKEMMNIPYGETMTYHELAGKSGYPKALRAVGAANGKNPLCVIVPCHRVIGSDGKLTGYAFGLWRKKWLLEHEYAFAQRDLFYAKV